MITKQATGCPRCNAPWEEIGPDGGRCKVHGFVARGEIAQSRRTPEEPQNLTPAAPWTAITVRLCDVQREAITWRWNGRLPVGKVVMLEGDPGVGKSWLSLAVATAVTTGAALPGDSGIYPPKGVLIMTAEDGLGDTVRPRLEDMEAHLAQVTALTAVRDDQGRERIPSLVDDLVLIENELDKGDFGLVILDPINAYLGTDLDTHRDAALRAVLGPLAALAERWRVTIIAIRHLTKGQRDRAIYRGQGGIAYAAAARVVLLAGLNPANPLEGVLAVLKNNLAPKPPALTFSITEGRFLWGAETDVTPAALLAPDAPQEERMTRDDAEGLLRELLTNGPLPVKEVESEAKSAGISWRTVERAKAALNIRASRVQEGFGGGRGHWVWALPTQVRQPSYRDVVAPLCEAESDRRADGQEVGALVSEVSCPVCGCRDFWFRPDGSGPVCCRCHPPPQEVRR